MEDLFESGNAELDYDEASERMTVRASLRHFSTIVAGRGLIIVTLSAPDEAIVGEPFQVQLTFERLTSRVSPMTNYSDRSFFIWRDEPMISEPWRVSGSFRTWRSFTPALVPDRPPPTGTTRPTFSLEQTFTCLEPTPSLFRSPKITWDGRLEVTQTVTKVLADGTEEPATEYATPGDEGVYTRTETVFGIDVRVRCRAPEPEETDRIDVLQIDGHSYPVEQFFVFPAAAATISGGGASGQTYEGDPEFACSEDHWHAGTVYSVEEIPFALEEFYPSGCGFGKVSDIPPISIDAAQPHLDAYHAARAAGP